MASEQTTLEAMETNERLTLTGSGMIKEGQTRKGRYL
jgi:hypothetical protein